MIDSDSARTTFARPQADAPPGALPASALPANSPTLSSPSTSPLAADEDSTIPLTGIALVLAIAGLLLFMAVPTRPLDAATLAVQRAEVELRSALEELRSAIGEYRLDHDAWPASDPDSASEDATSREDRFVRQLELFTDPAGHAASRRLSTHPLGPYLTHGVPANPFGGSTRVRVLEPDEEFPGSPAGGGGWIYSPRTGELRADAPGYLQGTGERIFDL